MFSNDRYDVNATVAAPLTQTQMLPKLQGVLADRVALRLHIECAIRLCMRCGS